MPEKQSFLIRTALAASLLALATATAAAQGYGPYGNDTPYNSGPNESVTVTAPRFKADTTRLNAPMERVSLSKPIHYTFRDLVDPARSQALRWRVWRTAHEVCQRLAEGYPVYRMSTAPSCFREAYNDAMVKIDARISGARLAYRYAY